VQITPMMIGTNQVLGWHVSPASAPLPGDNRLNVELVNLSPAGAFFVAFQVAFYGGMVLASPFILYFIASFVFPALRLNERKHIYRALFFGGGLFLTGICFCYFILMPVALAAAQLYSKWMGFSAFQWRAEDYISFVCKFMLGMGLGFELPVVILTLVKIGVLNYSTLAKARRYMIVINLILGGVLTTPEPITQLVMFVPLQLLYEITVWIAWYWDRQERKKAAN
jgi:sec-independent protein translocase protein TatC